MQYINNEYATAKVRDEYMERIEKYMNPKPRNRAERRKHTTSKRKERFYE